VIYFNLQTKNFASYFVLQTSKLCFNNSLFCSLVVLDPRVGHTMDVLSPFLSVLCLFHRESCPRLDVVHPGRVWSCSPACTWHCNSLVSSWCDHSMLVSLLWQCVIVVTVTFSNYLSSHSCIFTASQYPTLPAGSTHDLPTATNSMYRVIVA